jgi:Flp pilus assembly protein TadD
MPPTELTLKGLLDLGNDLYQRGRFAEAEATYRRLLGLAPDHAVGLGNLGAAIADQGRHDEAIDLYGRAIALDSRLFAPWHNLGNSLRALGRWDEAEQTARDLLGRHPDVAEVHVNLGVALFHQRRLDEAEASYRRAVALRADLVRGWSNLGLSLAEQGRLDEAMVCHDQAIRLGPEDPDAHRNRSLTMLLMGNLAQGYREYEWRWRCSDFRPLQIHQPLWRGQEAPGAVLLVYAEQGLGDTLQFVRYAPRARHRVGEFWLVAREGLLPLLGRCIGIDRLIPMGSHVHGFDYHVPLLSLPAVLGTSLASVPSDVPYVFADESRTGAWREMLASLEGLRVGIGWRADPNGYRGAERSVPLACFEALARVPGVHLVSLHKELESGPSPEFELYEFGPKLDKEGGAFEDTAALMLGLELVVTCDTAIAHLAGGLGVPVWVALPKVPDWRWLMHRPDTPWYPTMRLYRQTKAGDWSGPFAAMARDLTRLVQSHSRDQGAL